MTSTLLNSSESFCDFRDLAHKKTRVFPAMIYFRVPLPAHYCRRWSLLLLCSEWPSSAPYFVLKLRKGLFPHSLSHNPVEISPSVALCQAKSEGGKEVGRLRSNHRENSGFLKGLTPLSACVSRLSINYLPCPQSRRTSG